MKRNFLGQVARLALVVIIIAAFFILVACGNSAGPKDGGNSVSLATSSTGSVPYIISVGMTDLLNKNTDINAGVQSFGGSDASIRALRKGKVNLAMVNTLTAYNAFQGTEQFAGEGKSTSLRLLMQGNLTPRYIAVRDSAGVSQISDLKGKTLVGKRPALADIEITLKSYLQIAGMGEKDVNVVETAETNEALNALRGGSVDAIVNTTNPTEAAFQEVARAVPITILTLNKEQIQSASVQELEQRGFALMSLKSGPHKLSDEQGSVLATRMALVASADLPDEIAYKIVMAMNKNYDALKQVHALAKDWTAQNTVSNPPIPFHSGAVKALKELGVWSDALEKLQSK